MKAPLLARGRKWLVCLGLLFAVMGLALIVPSAAFAQSFSLDLGQNGGDHGTTGRLVQITALFTVLSLAPSMLVMVTAFTRIIVVLTLLRGALGAQGTPPNMVIVGFSMFLTFFVMQPTLDRAWTEGVQPMVQGQMPEMKALQLAAEPFRSFMAANAKPSDLQSFEDIGHIVPEPGPAPWRALIPAFMVGELRRAFEMGFLLYLPFTIIDLVVSSVLMSLGMMMLPPNGVSLPFKLIFFVMVDGWRMVAGSLTQSFVPG